jgi:hypothetical protein
MPFFIIIFILFFSTKIFSIENNQLISEKDLHYLFENNQKKWNETLIFLDKKKSLSKINGSNDVYFLKSYFNYGYVIIMPHFKNNIIYKILFTYKFDKFDDEISDIFFNHYMNSFNKFCSKVSRNKLYLNIEIKRCN